MFGADKGLQATIQRMLADINALKGRGIIDIIPGDNIIINKRNPRKPIISSTATGGNGGGSSFIPNGIKFIAESRELQADDAGYFLILMPETPETDVILTIPEISPIPVGGVFAVVNQMDATGKNNGIINTTTEGAVLKLGAGETLVYTVTNPNICIPISTIEVNDRGEIKTALRYLMDNAGALYPNGVEVVTATRDFQDSDIGKFLFLTDGVGLTMPTSAPFYPNNKLIGIFAGSTNYPCDNFYEVVPGKKVYLYGAGHAVQTSNESLTLITGSDFDNSQQTVAPVNGNPVFVNESDAVGYTATRYLMDNVGKSSLFPNGIKLVAESRDYQADDAGCLLALDRDVQLTMPAVNPFSLNDVIGICTEDNGTFAIENGGGQIKIQDGGLEGEVVILTTLILGSDKFLIPLSTNIVDDNGVLKTSIRYLYEKTSNLESHKIVTKSEIDALIASNSLVPGALYEIRGVHPTLYNDGATSGTTVYLRAISGSELEVQGMGKFYNPKYNQAVDGFGIWDNKMYGTFTSIVGQFDYLNKEGVTANNGATGLMLANGMIQFVSGDWSAAISITGAVSGATANIAGFVSPSYGVGDKVIWGGYSWTNVNGNIGASVDVLNLDAEWTKNVYDTTNYNIAYDLIEYDYANDMIIRRFEKESNVDVKCSKTQYDYFAIVKGFVYHPISVQQFGNVFNLLTSAGQLNIDVNNGYNESINFSGKYQVLLTFGSSAYQHNLTFGNGVFQALLTFSKESYQKDITFSINAQQSNLNFGNIASQNNIIFGSGSYQNFIKFGDYVSQKNITFNNGIHQLNLNFGESTKLNFNNQTINSNMEYVSFRTKNVTVPDLSAATYIYDGNIKDVYQRPDGALKIKYYDNSDVLQIVDIND